MRLPCGSCPYWKGCPGVCQLLTVCEHRYYDNFCLPVPGRQKEVTVCHCATASSYSATQRGHCVWLPERGHCVTEHVLPRPHIVLLCWHCQRDAATAFRLSLYPASHTRVFCIHMFTAYFIELWLLKAKASHNIGNYNIRISIFTLSLDSFFRIKTTCLCSAVVSSVDQRLRDRRFKASSDHHFRAGSGCVDSLLRDKCPCNLPAPDLMSAG